MDDLWHSLSDSASSLDDTAIGSWLRGNWEQAQRVREEAAQARATREQARQRRRHAAHARTEARLAGLQRLIRELTRSGETHRSPLFRSLQPRMKELAALLQHLERAKEPSLETLPAPSMRARIYAWGFGRPQSGLLQRSGAATPDARQFAADRGWEAGRTGAWAMELALPLSLSEALKRLEPELRADPAVRGWGGKMIRASEIAPAEPVTAPSHLGFHARPDRDGAEAAVSVFHAGPLDGSEYSTTKGQPTIRQVRERSDLLLQQSQALLFRTQALSEMRQTQLALMEERRRQLRRTARSGSMTIGSAAAARPEAPAAGARRSWPGVDVLPDLPLEEFEALNAQVTRAHDLAGAGHLAAGYSVLLAGLHRAAGAGGAGVSWAEPLIQIYELALENYVARYGVGLG